jgi:hypothetical protein
MDRPARLALAALLALALLAGCAHRHSGGVGNSAFIPDGPPVPARHIGYVGTGCHPPSGPLRVEARTGERAFRVSNPTEAPIDFYYDWASSFGEYQMFFIRFTDGGGDLVGLRGSSCGWWSPKENDANLWIPGRWPGRRRLSVPAGGHIDIPIDQEALTWWWSYGHRDAATGPCAMQVRLFGYLAPDTWDGVSAETGWVPVPCPSGGPANPWLESPPASAPS